MELVAGCLGLPLQGLGLGLGFFGATLAVGLVARAFELEEGRSCDACANCERSPDRSGATHPSGAARQGPATRFPIRDQGRLTTPKINKRPGTSI